MNSETTKTTNTPLQTALIAAGMESIPFATNGTTQPVAIADLPDATLLRVLTYGKRMFNDYVNSTKATSDTSPTDLAKGWITRAKAGTLGQSATRSTLTPQARAERDIVIDYLRKQGDKTAEARKLIKSLGTEAAFKSLLARKIGLAQGCTGLEVDSDILASAMETNWVKVVTQAERVVRASAINVDIDLT